MAKLRKNKRKSKEKKQKDKSHRKARKEKQKNAEPSPQDVHADTTKLNSQIETQVQVEIIDGSEGTKDVNSVAEKDVENKVCTEAPAETQPQLFQDKVSDSNQNSALPIENITASANVVKQNESEKKKKNLLKILPGWKSIVKPLFSFVGLFVLLILYIIGGAYWFYELEKPLELERQNEMLVQHKLAAASVTYLADFLTDIHFNPVRSYDNCSKYADLDVNYVSKGTYSNACLKVTPLEKQQSPFCSCIKIYQERYENMALEGINRMVAQLVHAAKHYKYKIEKSTNDTKWENKWTPGNSVLFTMSSLTLIGYGHITPTTTSGKLQLVAYIIVGLPLMMVFLSNIGNSMASGLKLFYSRIGCRWCRIRRKKSELEAAHGLLAPPAITRRNDVDRPTQPVMNRGGFTSHMENFISDEEMGANTIGKQKDDMWASETEHDAKLPENVNILTLSDDQVGYETYMPTAGVSVPIIVTLCIMLTYIVLGALVFALLEEWKLSDAIYFSFITLTTIGFGDFVPSPSPQNSEGANLAKLIFTSIYCLIGLALISMGISLMQEQVIGKITWCVNEMGLRETEEDTMTKYILTKHYAIVTTPSYNNGSQQLDIEKQFTDLSELDSDTGKNMVGSSIYFVEQGIRDDEAVAKQEEAEETKDSGTSDDNSMTEDYTSDASSGHFQFK